MKPSTRKINPLKIASEVLNAINRGKRTFSEIKEETGRTADRVSEALAFLLFKAKRIRTARSSSGHLYFPATQPDRKPEPQPVTLCETAPLSFSTLSALMPARATVRVSEARK